MKHKPPTDAELDAAAAGVEGLPERGWRHDGAASLDLFSARDPEGSEPVHLYAHPDRGQALVRALDLARTEVPRLVAEVRRLRGELVEARARPAPTPAPTPLPPPRPAAAPPSALDLDEDAGLGLAAPFRVSPREVSAAKTDPLVALAVQVARALQADAKDVERARLIAMAYGAARGDLDAFWSARRMRTTRTPESSAPARTGRKK